MLTRQALVNWVGLHYGSRHAEARITDRGFAYLVNTQPDAVFDGDQSAMTYGNGPDVVLKSTGEVWQLGSNPVVFPAYEARSEKRFRRELHKLNIGPADRWIPLDVPALVMPPAALREVTTEAVAEWLRDHGLGHPNSHVTDLGWGFVVNDRLVVVKRTGGVWYLPFQEYRPAMAAASEQAFYATMHGFGFDPNLPSSRVPDVEPGVTREQVLEWVHIRYRFAHLDDRIGDLGFAFVINTQPDAYLDGDESAMTFGNGPTYVIKKTGAVWMLSSNPMMLPVFDARTEDEFYEALREDPAKPHEWVRF